LRFRCCHQRIVVPCAWSQEGPTAVSLRNPLHEGWMEKRGVSWSCIPTWYRLQCDRTRDVWLDRTSNTPGSFSIFRKPRYFVLKGAYLFRFASPAVRSKHTHGVCRCLTFADADDLRALSPKVFRCLSTMRSGIVSSSLINVRQLAVPASFLLSRQHHLQPLTYPMRLLFDA